MARRSVACAFLLLGCIGLLAPASAPAAPASTPAFWVTPLNGSYTGLDSNGERVSFNVQATTPGATEQLAITTQAGTYSSLCQPLGLVHGPMVDVECLAGAGNPPAVVARVGMVAVYADATVDSDNHAVFNGTLTAVYQPNENPVPLPDVTFRAELSNPAAVATLVGIQHTAASGVATPTVRCAATGVRSCRGTVTVKGGGQTGRARFRLPDGASKRVRVRLPGRLASRLNIGGPVPVNLTVRSSHPRTLTVVRRAKGQLTPP
jgi:hypothetical protein